MDIRKVMLEEFREELAATRKILERVPEDKLTWKPHQKSMSLGQLSMHIATLPGAIAMMTRPDSFDVATGNFTPPQPQSRQEILTALEKSVPEVEKSFTETSAADAEGPWRLLMGDRELMTRPRYAIWRTILLNHWYHHRAQLGVYLRLLEVPVPVVYGPTADENPFIG